MGELFCAIVACIGPNPKQDCGQRFPATIPILHRTVEFQKVVVTMTTTASDKILKDVMAMPSTCTVNMLPFNPKQFEYSDRTIEQFVYSIKLIWSCKYSVSILG